MNKKITILLSILFVALVAAGCGEEKKPASQANETKKVLKVGATAGPQAQILEAVQPVLAKEGITMEIIEFNDFATPNEALSQGDLDANSMQHKPFLDSMIDSRGYKLTPIGQTVLMPMGLYSNKVQNLADLADGATVAIPNDPSNGGRGLLLLQSEGLIKLDEAAGILPSPADIIDNPKNLQVIEVEAAQAPRVLDDVDLVAVNTNYALVAGLSPQEDSLALEGKDSPYTCVLVVRTEEKDNESLQKLLQAYQSPEVAEFINQTFQGSIVKGW